MTSVRILFGGELLGRIAKVRDYLERTHYHSFGCPSSWILKRGGDKNKKQGHKTIVSTDPIRVT
jgi:hypothetical protein